ncbi:MAG: glycosyltransferase family 2 protein [Thermodesulfobacteriota bacterium]
MDRLTLFLMLTYTSNLLLLGVLGRRFIKGRPDITEVEPERWPAVTVIVPATGQDDGQDECLAALVNQDYPDYRLIFVTQDQADLATRIIEPGIKDQPRARLVHAGPTASSCQKNHNLLAGLKALDESTEVIVFCDMTRKAPREWLKNLVRPVANNQSQAASGYYFTYVRSSGVATWGRALTALVLHLLQAMPWFTQTWGGNTAIRRRTFEDLDVAGYWSRQIVDDVSLAALLLRAGIKVIYAPQADLTASLENCRLSDWIAWLVRQWIYLKFYFPITWLAAGLYVYLLAVVMSLSLIWTLAAPWGWVDPVFGWMALAFLASGGLLACLSLRPIHPRPPSWAKWLLAGLVTVYVGAWCHFLTVLTCKVHWRGITYQADWKGRVKEIIRN